MYFVDRFKRMAVDIDQEQPDFNVTQYLQEERMKRLQTFKPKGRSDMLRPPTPKRCPTPMPVSGEDTMTECPEFSQSQNPSGSCKRKRGIKGSGSFEVLDEGTLEEAPETQLYVHENTNTSLFIFCAN